jgi:hypothetical protein
LEQARAEFRKKKVRGNQRTSQPPPNGEPGEHTARFSGEAGSDDGGTAALESISAPELMALELPEPKWAVPEIVPEGLSILVGRPKIGKSWLALGLAIAVASGGVALGKIRVEPGDVLYLALEDSHRRLRKRLAKLLGGGPTPPRLHLVTRCPRTDKGGTAALLEWTSQHADTRLVVVDTLAKLRPRRVRAGNRYDEDYDDAAELKQLADNRGMGLVALHHDRKAPAEDPFDTVSGTLGLTGAADSIMVLKKERGQHDACLFITGRDVEDKELALRWDPAYALWSILGEAEQYRVSKERQEVIDLLASATTPLTPKEVAAGLDKKPGAVGKLLWSMARDGQLVTADGRYSLPGNPGNRVNGVYREPGWDDE